MYLVEVYNKNTSVRSQYFAETWTKIITIFNLVVSIDTQKVYSKTVKRTEGTITFCEIICDNFIITIHKIQDFNKFYESESCKNCGETVSNSQNDNNISANWISIGYLSDCECPVNVDKVAKVASPTAGIENHCYNSDKVAQVASPTGINMEKFGKCEENC